MKAPKIVAMGLATALACSGIAVAAGGAAQAYGPTSQTLAGALYLSNSAVKVTPTTVNTYTDTFTLAESPASPITGDTVTVTATGAHGPTVGPVDVSGGSQVVRATVAISGSQTGTVSLASGGGTACTYPASTITGDGVSTEGPWTTSGTYTATAAGSTTATVTQVMFDDEGNLDGSGTMLCAGSGSNADYYVTGSASTNAKTDLVDTPITDTYTHYFGATASDVKNEQTNSVPVASPIALRAGDSFAVSGGTGLTPSGTLHYSICTDAAGKTCSPAAVESGVFGADGANALPAVDGSGDVTAGRLKLLSISTYSGLNYIMLWQGTSNGFSNVYTAKSKPTPVILLKAPTVTAPAGYAAGQSIAVGGAGWYPGEMVTINENRASTPGTDPSVTAVADANGVISTHLTVNDTSAVQLAGDGIGAAAPTVAIAHDTVAPTATSQSIGATTGWAGSSTTLTIAGAADNVFAANKVVATVNWGEGSPETLAAGVVTANHTYTTAGAHAVTVTLADPANNTSAALPAGTFTVTVPNATFTRSATALYLTKSLSLKPSGVTSDVSSISVNWGDGTTSNNVSKTAATAHVYKKAGTFTIKATLKNAGAQSVVKTVGTVKVVKDTSRPSVSLTVPKSPTKGSSWTTIKGKASDTGLGVEGVAVLLIEKNKSNGKWYYYNGKKWVKTTSKAKAEDKAAGLVDTSIVKGAWSVKLKKKPAKGTLYVAYVALDKAGNATGKTKKQKITK